MDDRCIHDLEAGQCSLCSTRQAGPAPSAVSAGHKAAAARGGRVLLPAGRFGEEVDRAVAALRAGGEAVTIAAVQRVVRAAGYQSGSRPTRAALRERGLLDG